MNSEIKIEDKQPKDSEEVQTSQATTLRGPQKQQFSPKKLVNKIQDDFSQSQRKEKWNSTESRRYITFLKKNTALFGLSFEERRKAKINVKMSRLVKTKNPSQCHSHHQKMMLKYGSLEAIIEQNLHLTSQMVGMFKKKTTLSEKEDQIKEEVQSLPKAYTEENEQYQKLNEDQWLQFLESSVFQKPKSLFDLLDQ